MTPERRRLIAQRGNAALRRANKQHQFNTNTGSEAAVKRHHKTVDGVSMTREEKDGNQD